MQSVFLGNGVSSGYENVTQGVPQGSVLGPLLFLIFINDLPNASNKFKFTLFADDSTLTYSFSRSELQMSHQILNSELPKINHWLLVNNIRIIIIIIIKFIETLDYKRNTKKKQKI